MNYRVARTWLTVGALSSVWLASPVLAGPGADAIEGLSPEAFRRCGLDKLSASELTELKARLDAALMSAAPVASDLPRGDAAFGREEEVRRKTEVRQEIPDSISSRIAGEFRGWSGDTIFTLENGQVWRQVGSGTAYLRLQSPAVMIERGQMGAFFLRVEGLGSRVKVKRLK